MADRELEIVAKIAAGVSGLNARAWDRLAGDNPFVGHAFLGALEDSGSVGPGDRVDTRADPYRGRRLSPGRCGARLPQVT